MMRFRGVFGMGIVLVLLSGSVVASASPVGGDFRVSGANATSDEWFPAVAYNPKANQYLVAWQDRRNEATRGWDIYVGRVGADGEPVGGDFRISGANATSDSGFPAVAYNPKANQYLVVWQDWRNSNESAPGLEYGPGWDIYGRRVGADGKPVGGDFRISGANATSGEWAVAVAYNPQANQYLVVWTDGRNEATRGWDIYGRRVGADGKPVGGDFRVSGANATSFEDNPALAYNREANQYLVVWLDGRGGGIYGRRVGADGKPVGGDFRVSGANATNLVQSPAVAYNPKANQYLVVWEDGRNEATRGRDVYGRRVGADGKPVGGDFRVSGANATSGDWVPAVAYNPKANQYLVVWEEGLRFGVGDILGRRVGADGKPVGGDFRISGANATSDEWAPAVAYNPKASQYLVTWADYRNGAGRGWDIYGRRVAG